MSKNTEKWLADLREYEGQFASYKYLGWQVGLENPDYKKCYDLGHMKWKEGTYTPAVVKEKSFSNRGTHHTYNCDECKIWWNIDMGD